MTLIYGYKDYAITEDGQVISFKNGKQIIRKPFKLPSGYLMVKLCENSTIKKLYVHRLVAMAFISNPYNKPTVNHIDGNKENNNVFNLEWATSKEQMQHAFDMGLYNLRGESSPLAKLTHENVKKIRELYKTGKYFHREIGEMFGVSRRHIGDIVNYELWRYS